MYSYFVEYKSTVDNNLKESFLEYKRDHQDNLNFKNYIKKLGVGIKYRSGLYYRGYTILFEDKCKCSLFLLKWG